MNDELKMFFEYFFDDFTKNLNDPANVTHKLLLSILLIVLSIAVLKVSQFIIYRFIDNVKYSTTVYKTFQAILSAVTIVLLFTIWMRLQNSFLLIMLIIAAISFLSIKNLSNNLVAWLMLIRKNYFKLYDRIEVEGIKGDVIKITPFYFKIVERGNGLSSSTATGRVVHIPNHILLGTTVYNYNKFITFNWGEVKFFLTVDSDWKKALEIIESIGNQYVDDFLADYTDDEIHRIKRKLALFDEEIKLKTYVLLDDSQITIVAQYPIHYTKGTSTVSRLNQEIIPVLHDTPGVELSGKAVHVHMENDVVFRQKNE